MCDISGFSADSRFFYPSTTLFPGVIHITDWNMLSKPDHSLLAIISSFHIVFMCISNNHCKEASSTLSTNCSNTPSVVAAAIKAPRACPAIFTYTSNVHISYILISLITHASSLGSVWTFHIPKRIPDFGPSRFPLALLSFRRLSSEAFIISIESLHL